MVYLDYSAATPPEEEVLKTFYDISKRYYANPNVSHEFGLEAKRIVDESTKLIANLLGVMEEEVIYTSGASESNNLVIKGICQRYKNRGKHILISSLEHTSITKSATVMQSLGFEVEIIPVTKDGVVDLDSLKSMLRDDTILVSVCSVDSELGLVQPIEEIGEILKDYPNCIFHTDASLSVGKVGIDYSSAQLITVTPHKFYGLVGCGILIKKKDVFLIPQIDGGRSTTIYRSGTPEVASIKAASVALSIALSKEDERFEYVKKLSSYLKGELAKYKNVYINNTENSIPHTINFSVKKINSADIQKKLSDNQIYVSTKTSCCPVNTPSKLVYALTKDKALSSSSLRVSISHLTTKNDIDEFLRVFDVIYKEYEKDGKI
ncbi:MAG: cysteine desulfurase family protein [Clostridium sp.]|nr:cysteine desulfurase family protein [Clostridium sp.]